MPILILKLPGPTRAGKLKHTVVSCCCVRFMIRSSSMLVKFIVIMSAFGILVLSFAQTGVTLKQSSEHSHGDGCERTTSDRRVEGLGSLNAGMHKLQTSSLYKGFFLFLSWICCCCENFWAMARATTGNPPPQQPR